MFGNVTLVSDDDGMILGLVYGSLQGFGSRVGFENVTLVCDDDENIYLWLGLGKVGPGEG